MSLPIRKPMAVVRRVSLFEREIRVSLSAAALEILFDAATVLSEGERQAQRWFGTTMITVDLERAAGMASEPCDASTARKLAELIAHDARAREWARDLAAAEAEERAGARLSSLEVDLAVHASGRKVHIDLDVQGEIPRARVVK